MGRNDNERLPDEIMLAILLLLSPQHILSMKYLSKKFYRLVTDNSLWEAKLKLHHPYLSNNPIVDDEQPDSNRYRAFHFTSRNEYRDLPKGLDEIYSLVKEGDVETLEKEIEKNTIEYNTLEIQDIRGYTLVDWAKRNNHQAVLDLFFTKIITPFFSNISNFSFFDLSEKTILHNAVIYRQRVNKIAQLVALNGTVNILAQSNSHMNALHYAVEEDQVDSIHYLIKQGIPVDSQTNVGATGLLLAIEHDHIDSALALLKHNANMSLGLHTDSYYHKTFDVYVGDTPLNVAVKLDRPHFVSALLENGAPVNAGIGSISPLHLAAKYDCADIAELLLKKGAKINAPSSHGDTALLFSIEYQHDAVFTVLLEYYPNVNFALQIDSEYHKQFNVIAGDTPLHVAVRQGRTHIVQALIQARANLDMNNSAGHTPLHIAIQNGYLEIVRMLVLAGANRSALTHERHNALFLAVIENKPGIITFLVSQGEDVNARNELGATPLFVSIIGGHKKTIKVLLLLEADTTIRLGQTNEYYNKLKLLPGDTPLHAAIIKNLTMGVACLLEAGANINATRENGFTPLQLVAELNRHNIARLLCNNATIDLNDCGKIGCTPLFVAAINNSNSICVILIDRKVNVALRCSSTNTPYPNNVGDSPLHAAIKLGHFQVMQSLIRRGASLEQTDAAGNNALHLSIIHQKLELAEHILFSYQPNVNARNAEGATALLLATELNLESIVLILLIANANVFIPLEENSRYHCNYNVIAGDTPLHVAARLGLELLGCTILKQNTKTVEVINADKETPLDVITDKRSSFAYKLKLADLALKINHYQPNISPTVFGYAFKIGRPIEQKKAAANALVDFVFNYANGSVLDAHKETLNSDELKFIYRGLRL